MKMVRIDYLTLTSRLIATSEIPVKDNFSDKNFMQWQAGIALYKGFIYRYDSGSLQILWSEEQGLLLRISGNLCEDYAELLDADNFNCTRLDLCLDVEREIDLDYWFRLQKSEGKKIHATNINNECLYIGSRRSLRFWRIYNKALEQGLEGVCLYRIECELKGLRANQAKVCVKEKNFRKSFFKNNAIGIVKEMLDVYMEEGEKKEEELNLKLPRGKPAGKRFLLKVVVPFLKSNPWALVYLTRKGIL